MASLLNTLREGLFYRGGASQWNFVFHRLAGLGTLLFLAIHIIDTSWVYFAPELYQHAIELYGNPVFMVGEVFLVLSVIFHGVNGLKLILFDYIPNLWSIENERRSMPIVYGLTLVLWLPAAFIMASNAIEAMLG